MVQSVETMDVYTVIAPFFYSGLFLLLFVMVFFALAAAARQLIDWFRGM